MGQYSQNNEEQAIVEYFHWAPPPLNNRVPRLLDIGANDGKTFSNSLRMIELGWQAVLVEPSPVAFAKLQALHGGNSLVRLHNVAVGISSGKMVLHESGAHLPDGSDRALLSSLKVEETRKWRGVEFKEQKVEVVTYTGLAALSGGGLFDFITIDAEGMDLEILRQIDLSDTSLLCIEWNGRAEVKMEVLDFCARFGLNRLVYESIENLVVGR